MRSWWPWSFLGHSGEFGSGLAFGVSLIASLLIPAYAGAVTLGQHDSFSGPSLDGWSRGVALADAGPEGVGDDALEMVADGFVTDGKIVNFNQSQWSGDYLAAGITAIMIDVNNTGANDLLLRVVFGTTSFPRFGLGDWYASIQAVPVMAGSGWQTILLPIGPTDLRRVQGSGGYSDALGSVSTMRLLHSAVPRTQGDPIVATLRIDNITAVPEPGTGLLVLTGLLGLASGRRGRSQGRVDENAALGTARLT